MALIIFLPLQHTSAEATGLSIVPVTPASVEEMMLPSLQLLKNTPLPDSLPTLDTALEGMSFDTAELIPLSAAEAAVLAAPIPVPDGDTVTRAVSSTQEQALVVDHVIEGPTHTVTMNLVPTPSGAGSLVAEYISVSVAPASTDTYDVTWATVDTAPQSEAVDVGMIIQCPNGCLAGAIASNAVITIGCGLIGIANPPTGLKCGLTLGTLNTIAWTSCTNAECTVEAEATMQVQPPSCTNAGNCGIGATVETVAVNVRSGSALATWHRLREPTVIYTWHTMSVTNVLVSRTFLLGGAAKDNQGTPVWCTHYMESGIWANLSNGYTLYGTAGSAKPVQTYC
jgi:hypothetical protein